MIIHVGFPLLLLKNKYPETTDKGLLVQRQEYFIWLCVSLRYFLKTELSSMNGVLNEDVSFIN